MHKILKIALAVALTLPVSTGGAAQQRSLYNGSTHQRVAAKNIATQGSAARMTVENPTFPRGWKAMNTPWHAQPAKISAKAPMKVLGDGTTLYGSLIFSADWSGSTGSYGIYSFNSGAYAKPTLLVNQGSYDANGGGCYANGKYYYNSFVYTDEMGYTFSTFLTYDFATGTMSKQTQSFMSDTFDQSQITSDMTYDPTTNTVYALSYISVEVVEGMMNRFYPALSVVDTYSGYVTPIARIPSMIAIACNQSGELYAISKGANSALYRLNKETGDYTEIGPTGLNPEYIQSATFDPVTDKLYWAAVEYNGNTGLYEVDVTTGAASKITDFLAHEEYAGLYIPEPQVAANAPAGAENLTAVFDRDSHSGRFDFNAPTTDYSGARLSGDVTVTLAIDGEEQLTESVAPGQLVSTDIELDEGIHNFTVSVSNAAGAGPRKGYSHYVGLDAPEAVANLTLTPGENGSASITWEAPAKGRNDGYIDPDKVTYKIVRMPDNTVVANGLRSTFFNDPVNASTNNYYYIVTPYCDGREGISASTAQAVLGNGASLPCTFDFATREQYDLFTVIDANNDFDAQYKWGGWMYGPDFTYAADQGNCAVYGYSPENAADDWLITPPFAVEKGKRYRLTFAMWTKGDKETLEVTAGPGNTVADQSVIIPSAIYSHKQPNDYIQEFTASTTGNYYVGFHITSPKKRFYLFIGAINIDEVPDPDAPAPVSDLTATPGEKGAMTAQISLTAPSKSVDGSALSSLSRIDIFRGNNTEAIHSFESPAPGAALSWTDTDPLDGYNTYRVVAYSGDKAGEKAETTVFVGYDLPVAPANFTLTEEDGHPVLRWKAPSEGQNGGYVDPAGLSYAIYRSDGALLTMSATGEEYIDRSLDGNKKQYFVYYQIYPVSPAGPGDYALSNHIIFGKPYEGNFVESFSDQATQNDPWVMYLLKGSGQLWGLYSQGYSPTCSAVDGDYGLATFSATSGRTGDEGRLVSPKLNLASFDTPILTFYFYHNPSTDTLYGEDPFEDRMIPEVLLPSGEYVALSEPIYVDDPTTESGWYQYTFDLSRFKSEAYVQLSFHGIADYEQDVNIDLVEVTNKVAYDLQMYSFSGPARVKAGKTAKFKATLYNNGVNTAVNYLLMLTRDGEAVAEIEGPAVKPGAYVTIEIPVVTDNADEDKSYRFQAVIDYFDDCIQANNTSEVLTMTVAPADLPEVYKVDAAVSGVNDVALTWGTPDALHVNDDFEDYPAYSIDNIGDYTLVDADEGYTYGFADIYFENTGAPQAFMVFNPDKLGLNMLEDWRARSGSQVMAAFQAAGTDGYSINSDNWLISPEVHGGQTISFWGKTANWEWGLEEFEVLYSTSSTDLASFKSLSGDLTAAKDWTLYEFTLPANARYFAIRHKSKDQFVFYLDDLKFVGRLLQAPAELTGYRVYRDGVMIAELPAGSTAYTDTNVADGAHNYEVTALYGRRESGRSDKAPVTIGATGVESVDASAAVSVKAGNSVINIACADSARVTVTATSGITVFSATGDATYSVDVVPGIYIVSVDNRVFKVAVR